MSQTKIFDKKGSHIWGFFLKKFLPYAGALAVWLVVWQIAAHNIGIEFILPSPKATLLKLIEIMPTKSFGTAVCASLIRVLSGFAFGAVTGALIGSISFFLPFWETFFSPFLKVIRATPVSSFILLVMLWMKSDTVPIFIAFLMVFPIVCQNVLTGLKNTSQQLTEVAQMYCLSFPTKLRVLYLPNALPYFGASCKTSLGLAWKAGIAAEVLCVSRNSIGENLYLSNIYDSTGLLAWTVTVIVLSILTELFASLLFWTVKKLYSRRHSASDEAHNADIQVGTHI